MKTCRKCNETKDLELFPTDKRNSDGRRGQCLECKREDARAYSKKNYKYDKAKDKDAKLKRAYGISYDTYLNMRDEQDGKCAICGKYEEASKRQFAVDHCHDTGKVRGLLCSNCNTGIGNLNDDINMLNKAIEYLGG